MIIIEFWIFKEEGKYIVFSYNQTLFVFLTTILLYKMYFNYLRLKEIIFNIQYSKFDVYYIWSIILYKYRIAQIFFKRNAN